METFAENRELTEEKRKKKIEALENAVSKIEKQYGKGAIMKMDSSPSFQVERVSSGSMLVDKALGGGYPRGRVVEIYGPESGGKTTLALHAIAEIQKQGGQAVFIDAEHALDPDYAETIGVNISDMYICQPDCGEQALEIADEMIRSGAVDVMVIDSVAALVPRAELEGEMGDSHVGLQARLMSQALRKLTATVAKTNCVLIFINQIREKVGVMFGNPETTAGGRALKFYASIRIDIRRIETVKDSGEAIANRVRVKVVKNKVAPPFKEAEIKIVFGQGLDVVDEILTLSVQNGSIIKSGAWYSLPESSERIGQGAENAKKYIKDHPEFMEELVKKIKES